MLLLHTDNLSVTGSRKKKFAFAVKKLYFCSKFCGENIMYIHEKENWTDWRWNSEKILPTLTSVRHLQGKLLGQMESLGFDFTEKAT